MIIGILSSILVGATLCLFGLDDNLQEFLHLSDSAYWGFFVAIGIVWKLLGVFKTESKG
ncbi:hypothetical protein [Bacillus pseudomycoides]|uniref:hypothetical protein n=1 Tax=Bacillus pseudomycoides TaxID=64104 RepID=UPI00159BBC34|nr:hypothetical protein [Bacillus pseudomycoides]